MLTQLKSRRVILTQDADIVFNLPLVGAGAVCAVNSVGKVTGPVVGRTEI